jgi:DNA replication and repair protein RecF
MRIDSVSIYNFRNLQNRKVFCDNTFVTLVGNNGQGKTNFLEAIYTACYGNSFRKTKLSQLCTFNTHEAAVSITAFLDDGEKIKITYRIKDGKRTIYIQNKEIRDRKELIYMIPCIVFTHEDIDFVQGSPEEKRKFYNQTMTLYDPLFLDDMRKYKNLLKQRNSLLKDKRYDLLNLYDYQLADVGMDIQKKRSQLVKEFNELFPELFKRISLDEEKVYVVYKPSWKDCRSTEEAENKLRKSLENDMRYQTTTTGPHRDRFIVVRNGKNYIETASTGQKRLVSLILRSAQASFFTRKTGTKPIILLDDVLLELDIEKRERFLDNTRGFSQAFFTFLPGEAYFREGSFSGKVYRVIDGEFSDYEKSI